MSDLTLLCRDCGVAFTFTTGEQAFYQQLKLPTNPRRCTSCREARRADKRRRGYPHRAWRSGEGT